MSIFEGKQQISTDENGIIPSMIKHPVANGVIKKGQDSASTRRRRKIPEKVLVDGQTFCGSFPYHVLFDKNMVIRHCGLKLQELCPEINNDGAKVTDFFILRHPVIPLSVANIRLFIHNIFMAEIIRENMDTYYQKGPPMLVRGEYK